MSFAPSDGRPATPAGGTPGRGRRRRLLRALLALLGLAALAAGSGIAATNADFSATTGNMGNSLTAAASFPRYREAVLADHPSFYYRLDDDFRNGQAADETGTSPGRYDILYWFRQPGVTGDGNHAITFRPEYGSPWPCCGPRPKIFTQHLAGYTGVHTQSAISAPTTFTLEIWFRTTSTAGGKLIGFGSDQIWNSGAYDRHIYMLDDGRLTFGVWTGGALPTITTSSSYNDGAWHQVVASVGPDGIALYVDGGLQASDPSVTDSAIGVYSGYWRVGGDNLSSWPDEPTSYSLQGDLDEAAVYSGALTGTRVAAHFAARTGSGYAASILADSPYLYWRFDDAAGQVAADSSGNSHPGEFLRGKPLPTSTTGATSDGDGAAAFNGWSTLSSKEAFAGPTKYSLECWFRTTTTGGGKLIGFGNRQNAYSWFYDRHIYMQDDGHLTFGINPTSGLTTITTPSAYNDGTWHHVVATSGDDGIALYVDGALQASNSSVQGGEAHPGYWRVGGDNLTNWPNTPAGASIAADIDEVAVYPSELSASEVGAHHSAAAGNGYAAAVLADSPSLYWRLDENDFSNGAADSSAHGADAVALVYDDAFAPAAGAMRAAQPATSAVHFDGWSGVWNPAQQTAPQIFTEECWIRTTAFQGGKIIGFGDATTDESSSDDRHLYMRDDGTLSFGIFNGSAYSITTSRAYNDGSWHHVVASLGSAGMRLYVDGALEASDAGVTSAITYNGYWRIGGDGLYTWPGEPTMHYFTGDIAEVAVYPTQLTDDQVREHAYANH